MKPIDDAGAHGAVPGVLEPSSADLSAIRQLYERGLCLQAYHAARRFGDLSKWTGTAARVLAGRLAMNLGAPRQGRRLHLRAYRHEPTSAEARYYFGMAVMELRGPLAAWQLLKGFGNLDETSPAVRADLYTLRARAAGLLRDFVTAETWLAEAETTSPSKPWQAVERSGLLEMQDRYEEALAASHQALTLHAHPWYRPGVQTAAHVLQLLDRDAEALGLLAEADRQIENGLVAFQLAVLQIELGQLEQARQSLARYADLSPLLEKETAAALAAQRARVAYLLGDLSEAAEWAGTLDEPFFKGFVERLRQTQAKPRRVQLPVTFVRQHYKTCAPATLAALGRFWKMPSDHLALAESICYDGTPSHRQRSWAEDNGWVVREFRLAWESALLLLDRGVPFTVATVETANAHLQAVVGYDELRRTLLLRDPYLPYLVEAAADPFLENYRAHGPHAMALVPKDQRHLLEGLDLPESGLYDQLYRLERALFEHDRSQAQAAADAMAAVAADAPLTWHARRALAVYDANPTEILRCVEKLLEHFPNDGNLLLAKLSCLRETRREDRLAFLDDVCARPAVDPLFWQQYAFELSADARQHDRAARLLERSLRRRPLESASLGTLADILWHQRRFAEATELYRFAACLEDKREQFPRSYFLASRHLKQTDRALAHLQDRFRRFGARSALPACTLFEALCELERTSEAMAVLDDALRLRPHDAELLRFAAVARGRLSCLPEAHKLLAAAEGKLPRAVWLRSAAELAMLQGEQTMALGLWRQVLELEPNALDAHRSAALLLAETQGPTAALSHLEGVCRRFPHNFALHQLWIEWLREQSGPAATESVLRHLIGNHPADAWSRRELAFVLGLQHRFEEARAEANLAAHLEPNNPYSHCTCGKLSALAGDTAAAQGAYREAIRLSVDTSYAIGGLLEVCATHAARKDALAFVESELIRQVVFGDGLLTFRDLAAPVLEPEELLASLRVALKERPDLWHAHSALIQQLTDMPWLDEALDCARAATERFPLLPRLWVDLARVHQARLDRKGEIEALEQARQINPAWGFAARQLAGACQRDGQLDRARAVLEQAVARAPLDPLNHGCLAEVLWQLGSRAEALQRAQQAVRLTPGYDWAWRAVREWSQQLDQPQLAGDLARELTSRRAGEALAWLRLAESLNRPEDLGERLAALEKALALNPHCEAAHDLRAVLLANARRFDEALAACRPAAWGEAVPLLLRLRAAWVEFQRGQTRAAIEQMQHLLALNPDYGPGWHELADWCRQTGAYEEALGAAKRLCRLSPLDPVPLGYSADIKLRLGDRAGAKADFQRALQLDPQYSYAGFGLFDLQLEDGELEPAQATLATLDKHCSNEWLQARQAQLAGHRGDRDAVLRILRALCLSRQLDPWPINTVNNVAWQRGWQREMEALYQEVIEFPDVNPQVGCLWAYARAARSRWWCQRRLSAWLTRGEIGQRAVIGYLEALGNVAQAAKNRRDVSIPWTCRFHLHRLLRRHRGWLRANTAGWTWTAHALFCARGAGAVIRWMSNWREHAQAEPWVFAKLVMALRQRGRDAEADEVCRHALSLDRRDAASAEMELWLALEEALAGNVAAAQTRLATLNQTELSPYFRKILALATTLLEVQRADPSQRKFVLDQVRSRLREEFPGALLWHADRPLRRAFWRSMKCLAQAGGSAWPRWWALRKLRWPLP